MTKRLGLSAVLCSGIFLLFSGLVLAPSGAYAQTDESQSAAPAPSSSSTEQAPSSNSTENGGTSSESNGTVIPPVQVIQEQPKPKPKPRPRRVYHRPPPRQVPVAQPVVQQQPPSNFVDYPTNGVPMSPVAGANIPASKYPGAVSSVSGQAFQRQNFTDTAQDVLQQRVPSVIIDDLQGNAFQTNVQYRGFESSPVDGVAQGLAVYQNGVRINESFGDIVNYDVLPEVAIQSMDIISGNPVYGLNALGGALTIQMKNGFTYHGADLTVSGGSYGRAQGSAEIGMQSGNWAVYFGAERITDDGYRDYSASQIRRMYGDIGFKNSTAEIHLSVTGANNTVGVTAAAPEKLLALNWKRTFTSPQTTQNQVIMPQLTATVQVSPHWSLSGVLYYRRFTQAHIDGNVTDADGCDNNDAFLCVDGDPAYDQYGQPMPNIGVGEIDYTNQTANSWGTSLQATNTADVMGRHNHFLIGASYDYGDVNFDSSSQLGYFKPRFYVQGTGLYFGHVPGDPNSAANDLGPRDLGTTNTYVGIYFSDTYDLTKRLSATVGGRYNYADIKLSDKSGLDPFLNGNNKYYRFNPAAGLTYQITPSISAYGGYSEANRAPVAAELGCADPNHPCLIESFLTADPHLQQVVSNTWELGLRGDKTAADNSSRLQWKVGLFRTENYNDIITEYSTTAGRGVFVNGGDTLREGFEANIAYQTRKWDTYASYSYIRATYESNLILASANNPSAKASTCGGDEPDSDDDDSMACIAVHPGDTMPGIPANRLKIGGDYWVTPKWKVGGDILAVSGQYLYGDDANQQPQLGGYMTVNLHTSYDITPNIRIFALANNVFNNHYGVYGTFFDPGDANKGAAADPTLGPNFFNNGNTRSITPGPPAVVYGGMKVKFW